MFEYIVEKRFPVRKRDVCSLLRPAAIRRDFLKSPVRSGPHHSRTLRELRKLLGWLRQSKNSQLAQIATKWKLIFFYSTLKIAGRMDSSDFMKTQAVCWEHSYGTFSWSKAKDSTYLGYWCPQTVVGNNITLTALPYFLCSSTCFSGRTLEEP